MSKKTTSVKASEPEREFIANIDTANEEILRLDTALAEANESRAEAERQLGEMRTSLEAAPKPEALQSALDAQAKVEKDLKDLQEKYDKQAVELKEAQVKIDQS